MNINQLAYFLTLVDTLNYSTASLKHNISQPGLYRSISSLEQELDTVLFNKSGRNICLSRGGEIFVPHARKILDQLHIAQKELDDLKNRAQSPLHLAVAIDYDIKLFGDIVNSYMSKTQMQFLITQIQLPDIIKMLKQGDAEYGFSCLKQELCEDKEIAYRVIKRDKYCCFIAKNHPLAQKKSIKFTELRDLQFISYSEYGRRVHGARMAERGIKIKDYPGIYNKDAAFSLVEAGVGVCVAGKSSSFYDQDKVAAIELEDDFADFCMGFAWKKDRKFSKEASTFGQYLIDEYAMKND